MIKRNIEEKLIETLNHYSCLVLVGPRQVGKTTILNEIFVKSGKFNYVTLDDTNERELAKNNPKAFFSIHRPPLIIDEVQKASNILDEIEFIINETKRTKGNEESNGLFILTGSSQRAILHNVRESLAGRIALFHLPPLSFNEINDLKKEPFAIDYSSLMKGSNLINISEDELFNYMYYGFLPAIYEDEYKKDNLYFQSYIETYLFKDIYDLIEIKHPSIFKNFITLLASNTGQELVYTNFSRELGVDDKTIKNWVEILEKLGVVTLLKPYYENSFKKMVTKRPKVYWFDTGIVCHLLNLSTPEALKNSYLKGRIYETFVFNEIRKSFLNNGQNPNIYYYRDASQNEIDFLLINNGYIFPIECKFTYHYAPLTKEKITTLITSNMYKIGEYSIITLNDTLAYKDGALIIPFKCI